MPSILLVRHAQASFGAADYDVLSDLGHAQAAALADGLARRGIRVDRVLSGTLARQRDTAQPLATAAGVPVEVDPRWNEYDAHDILSSHSTTQARMDRPPGSTAPAMSSREFQAVLERALLDWIAAGAGGPAAETWPAFSARVVAALGDAAGRLESGQTALACTSGGALAAACVALLGLPATAAVGLNRVAINAGISKVAHGRSGSTLVSFNEHGHLERPGRSLVTYR